MIYNKGNILDSPLDCLIGVQYIDMAVVVVFTLVPGRVARYLHVKMLNDALEARQSFVRYISHEMRTPLNSVLVGLTYVRDEVSTVGTKPQMNFQNIRETPPLLAWWSRRL
jgi:signal transduction histidine kinase